MEEEKRVARATSTMGVVGILGFSFACCCGSGLVGSLIEGGAKRAEAPRAEAPQAPVQAPLPTPPEPPEEMPGWMDLDRVAGEEAGFAAGLTYRRIFEIRQSIWTFGQAHAGEPGYDPIPEVVKAEGLAEDVVWDAMVTAGENQKAMRDALRSGSRTLGAGVFGEVEVQHVTATELGAFTVDVVITAHGCVGEDDMGFRAKHAANQVAQNLPASASGFHATLWSKGLWCDGHSLGEATYDAASQRLKLKLR